MRERPADTTTDQPNIDPNSDPGDDPAEGRPDLGLPGADNQGPMTDRNDDLPERLGKRIENGSTSGIAPGEPDVVPDVEVPENTM
jgi:hypothetical protein